MVALVVGLGKVGEPGSSGWQELSSRDNRPETILLNKVQILPNKLNFS